MSCLRERAAKAGRRFLCKHGYEIRDEWQQGVYYGFVADDKGTLAFVQISATEDRKQGFCEERPLDRAGFERVALDWLCKHKAEDSQIRFDKIGIVALGGDRAFLRHHVNCYGVAYPGMT